MTAKLSHLEYINRANKFHNNKYDYSLTLYVNMTSQIKVKCPIHGVFEQRSGEHLRYGCIKCGNARCAEKCKRSVEDVIHQMRKVHDNFYNYPTQEYHNNRQQFNVICPIHGEFKQRVSHHLEGHGCIQCRNVKYSIEKAKTKEDFVKEANEVHDFLYTYCNFVYKNGTKKSYITCKHHGDFLQNAEVHLSGCGCPRCRASKGERNIEAYLKSQGYKFERQKKFDDCVGIKNKLSFDFYLPEFNLLIEFQGEHHYIPIKRWGGEEKLKVVQHRDELKKQYCKDNNIRLLEVPYFDKNYITTVDLYIQQLNPNVNILPVCII